MHTDCNRVPKAHDEKEPITFTRKKKCNRNSVKKVLKGDSNKKIHLVVKNEENLQQIS